MSFYRAGMLGSALFTIVQVAETNAQTIPVMGYVAAKNANPKRLEGALERIPLKRLGTPADMSGAALFLASPLASYIVGQTIVVDGGLIL